MLWSDKFTRQCLPNTLFWFDWISLVKLKFPVTLNCDTGYGLMQPTCTNQHNKACLCYYKPLKFHKPNVCISLLSIYHTTCQCTILCKCFKTVTRYQWAKKIAICFKIIGQSIKLLVNHLISEKVTVLPHLQRNENKNYMLNQQNKIFLKIYNVLYNTIIWVSSSYFDWEKFRK